MLVVLRGNMSSIFSINSGARTPELIEIIEDMLPRHSNNRV